MATEYRPHIEQALMDARRACALDDMSNWTDMQLGAMTRSTDTHRSVLKASGLIRTDTTIAHAYDSLTDRIRKLHIEAQRRASANAVRLQTPQTIAREDLDAGPIPLVITDEVNKAKEATRRIAALYEETKRELDALKQSSGNTRFLQHFYDVVRVMFADSTFKRIEAKAREYANSTFKRVPL